MSCRRSCPGGKQKKPPRGAAKSYQRGAGLLREQEHHIRTIPENQAVYIGILAFGYGTLRPCHIRSCHGVAIEPPANCRTNQGWVNRLPLETNVYDNQRFHHGALTEAGASASTSSSSSTPFS